MQQHNIMADYIYKDIHMQLYLNILNENPNNQNVCTV